MPAAETEEQRVWRAMEEARRRVAPLVERERESERGHGKILNLYLR